MSARRIIVIFLAFSLVVCMTALWEAEGNKLDGDTDTNVVAASGAEAGSDAAEAPKKKGNRFMRMLKSPFKAVGKLIGGKDEGGDSKLARMTEKDADRFESVGVVRVEDRTTERPAPAGEPVTARDHLERGRQLLAEDRLNEAIASLSTATSLDPKLSQAHSLLAVAYDRKGLRERARDSYERAVNVNESDAQAMNNLGYSLYLNGNYRAAVERLKRAAKLAPGDSRILNNLALAQVHLGKYDDAYKNFARAGGELSGHTNLASLLIRIGRDDKAAEHLEAARRIEPSSANVLRQLADLYQRTGRADKAEEARQALATEDARQQLFVAGGGR
ncbi:MAG TPA: tetratricopeptide repeat protein [Pyrinomonadaceae bacterium]|jgi:Flp pilus assembly protein TadD|nr:tetratricopeptide repeat protein [Pyrinomonadaceae bacterium]